MLTLATSLEDWFRTHDSAMVRPSASKRNARSGHRHSMMSVGIGRGKPRPPPHPIACRLLADWFVAIAAPARSGWLLAQGIGAEVAARVL